MSEIPPLANRAPALDRPARSGRIQAALAGPSIPVDPQSAEALVITYSLHQAATDMALFAVDHRGDRGGTEEEEEEEEAGGPHQNLKQAADALEDLSADLSAHVVNARRLERNVGKLKQAISGNEDWRAVPHILNNLQRDVSSISGFSISTMGRELQSIADCISAAPPPKDIVDCSVFAPPIVSAKREFTIQALLHSDDQLMQAAMIAAQFDDGANRRGFATLKAPVTRGTVIDLFLDCANLAIKVPVVSVTWSGAPVRANFDVVIPEHHSTETIEVELHIAIGGVPIGEIEFKVSVAQGPTVTFRAAPPLMPSGDRAVRYKNAFISYSRKDFDRVSFFAQGLTESGAKPCVDVTELEPGDDWADELSRFIEKADVVYVMWSDNAAKSDWVEKETRHAVALHNAGAIKRPKIKPIPLHLPWPKPPEHLERFHFYSEWQAHRLAQAHGLLHQNEAAGAKVTIERPNK